MLYTKNRLKTIVFRRTVVALWRAYKNTCFFGCVAIILDRNLHAGIIFVEIECDFDIIIV